MGNASDEVDEYGNPSQKVDDSDAVSNINTSDGAC